MPRSEINFVVRARGAVFKVRGPVTTSFGLGRGVEWGGGGQILLFSLCGCLELSDYKFQAAENFSNSRI